MTLQYIFNIQEMLEAFIPITQFIRDKKPVFVYGPFSTKTLEEIGINFIGDKKELEGVDKFMKTYLEKKNVNYARKDYA